MIRSFASASILALGFLAHAQETIFFQAHRGGLEEVAENTLAAVRYAWSIEGAVPEIDIQTTNDGHFVILHDATLARTTDAPDAIKQKPVSTLTLDQVRSCDAGIKFGAQYKGERVPTLDEVFDEMMSNPARRIYLDVKSADFAKLSDQIAARGIGNRVLFVHGDPKKCAELRALTPEAGAMTWLSGTPDRIKTRFEELRQINFAGLTQLQFHLHTKNNDTSTEFELDEEFLREAMRATKAANVDLQIRPFNLDPVCLKKLLDLGITWYVADAPRKLVDAVQAARKP